VRKLQKKGHQLYDHSRKRGKKVVSKNSDFENRKQETKIITIFKTKISID